MGTQLPPGTLPLGGIDVDQDLLRGVHKTRVLHGGFLGSYVWHGARLSLSLSSRSVLIRRQLFDADANRKIKKEPPVAVDMGKQLDLFCCDSEAAGGDVVSEMWSFAS
jgi:hypothetical protein